MRLGCQVELSVTWDVADAVSFFPRCDIKATPREPASTGMMDALARAERPKPAPRTATGGIKAFVGLPTLVVRPRAASTARPAGGGRSAPMPDPASHVAPPVAFVLAHDSDDAANSEMESDGEPPVPMPDPARIPRVPDCTHRMKWSNVLFVCGRSRPGVRQHAFSVWFIGA